MNNDRRTSQRPRIDAAEAAARRKRRAAEGAPTLSKKAPPSGRKRAERLYPDDAYYTRGQQTGAKRRKPAPRKRKKRTSFGRVLRNTVIAVVLAVALSFATNSFLFQIIQLSGDAMMNTYQTLLPGDWVAVTKYDYWSNAPKQGDIVAVKTRDGLLIRRVIGLPGQRVQIDANGDTLIDGNPLGEQYVHLKNYDEFPEVLLPGGRYFVLCDNRTVTYDSRDPAIDMVSRQDIVGKVRTVVWPIARSGTIQ